MIRNWLSARARTLLETISSHLPPPNVIFDHEGKELYLSRYYLFRGPKSQDGTHPFDEFGRPKPNIQRTDQWSFVLHKFHKSDSSDRLHNHGWTWGLSFVLCGGYIEEKIVGKEVVRKKVRPFSFNFFRSDEFHRVELLEKDVWTLFFRGPRTTEWFYKNRENHEVIPWDHHVKMGRTKQKSSQNSSAASV